MSTARLDKLRALLKRVEQRKAQPRLRAVQGLAQSSAPAASAPATAPPEPPSVELFIDSEPPPDTLPPGPDTLPPGAAENEPTIPPAAEEPAAARGSVPAAGSARPAAKSPIEDALARLPEGMEDSGPLQVQALAEPIAMTERVGPASQPTELAPHLTVTHRPEATPSLPQIELIPATHAPVLTHTGGVREPTLEFALRPQPGGPPLAVEPVLLERERAPAQPVAPSTAPTHTIEPAALPLDAAPARTISAPQPAQPKSFGELLELSLSLRPR